MRKQKQITQIRHGWNIKYEGGQQTIDGLVCTKPFERDLEYKLKLMKWLEHNIMKATSNINII
jgi:hypothetical protein